VTEPRRKPHQPRKNRVQPRPVSWQERWFSTTRKGIPAKGSPNIEAEDVRSRLEAAFPRGRFKFSVDRSLRAPIEFDDGTYYLPTVAEVERVFKRRTSKGWSDGSEILDCEDFAYWMKKDFIVNRYRSYDVARDRPNPFAVGILWGGMHDSDGHAVNVAVTFDAGVVIFDSTPDMPKIIQPASAWGRSVDFIVI
jgi:hypothetical protein